ncbi:MAG: transporter substrate-binding domain-containing protein [Desulfobacteraceae bacterium]|nr:transporter substrate-binding domain-containing protein [Desulfobacteraceae bacterium]
MVMHLSNHMEIKSIIWLMTAINIFIIWISIPCFAQTTLTFSTIHAPPLCAKELPGGGVFTQITREAFMRSGYVLKINFVKWKRGFKDTQEGLSDGLMLVSYKKDRIAFFNYTETVVKEKGALFAQKTSNIEYKKLEDLKPYSIGVLRGALLSDLLKAENLTVRELTSHEQNILMLANDRLDLVASQELPFYYLVNTKFPKWKGKFKMLLPPLHIGYLHNVISRKNPNSKKIVADFNKGLLAIQQDGTFNKLMMEHGLMEQN